MSTLSPEQEEARAAYNLIVKSAELGDIRLVGLNFKVNPAYYETIEEDGKRKPKNSFGVEISKPAYDADNQILGADFEWKVEITASRKKLLTISATFLAVYFNVPESDAKHHSAYLHRVGRFATYPYFRSLVAQMSWESHTELPVLPVLK
ncbi:hypothetical protein [Brucella intermedia]|uniref:hypothetical protein n=1 Tax=Brucella intermedia TaxID=94625 RepID=UPI0034CDD724